MLNFHFKASGFEMFRTTGKTSENLTRCKKGIWKVRQLVQDKSGNFRHVCNPHCENSARISSFLAHLYAARLQFAYIDRKINVPLWEQNSIIFFCVLHGLIGNIVGVVPIKLPLSLCF